jgi:hypothetical protein
VSIERAHAELLSLALVGAKAGVRAAPTLSELTPALALRLQHVAGMDAPPGQTVLRAAALIQQLLVMPNAPSTQALPEPLPCPAETRAPLNADACAVMQQALLEKSALLEEFVLYAAQQQLRVPEHLTVPLLEVSSLTELGRRAQLALSGTLGAWLLQLGKNPAFAHLQLIAANADANVAYADAFELRSGKERVAVFQQWRQAEAGAARLALEALFDSETPAQREALLQCLSAALSAADEPFLVRAAKDRRQEVRAIALSLLQRLPESALVARQWTRLQSLIVTIEPFEIALPPETLPADWREDGLDQALPSSGAGKRAQALIRLVSAVPPGFWRALAPVADISKWLQRISNHAFKDALLRGWMEASIRFADADWLVHLLLCPDIGKRANVFFQLDLPAAMAVLARHPLREAVVQALLAEHIDLPAALPNPMQGTDWLSGEQIIAWLKTVLELAAKPLRAPSPTHTVSIWDNVFYLYPKSIAALIAKAEPCALDLHAFAARIGHPLPPPHERNSALQNVLFAAELRRRFYISIAKGSST